MEEEFLKEAKRLVSVKKYKEAQNELVKVLILNAENKEAEELLKRIKDILQMME